MKFIHICFFVVTASCCSMLSAEDYQEYGYQHLIGTTGINMVLHSKTGEKINVQFSNESIAIAAFMKIDWSIIYPNADGERIVFLGELAPEIIETDSGVNKPKKESFRYFTLKHWYIKTPLKKQFMNEEDITAPPVIKMFNSLEAAGFKSFLYDKKEIQYSRFEQK